MGLVIDTDVWVLAEKSPHSLNLAKWGIAALPARFSHLHRAERQHYSRLPLPNVCAYLVSIKRGVCAIVL